MSNQTGGALRVLQWLGNMEARCQGLTASPRHVVKAWEEHSHQRKARAYRRLVKAVMVIPAHSPRERMTKFVAYGLRASVHLQLEKRKKGEGVPVLPWMDVGLLSDVDFGDGLWGKELADAYVAAIESSEPFECILGQLFNELVGSGQKNRDCQDFTPWSIATAMQRFLPLTVDAGQQMPLLNDPTCGSGTLLLAQLWGLVQKRRDDPDALKDIVVSANDRDPLCAAMTALQLLINQLVWERPIGCVHVECKDIISQLHVLAPVFASEAREDCPFELEVSG
jgi:hypothetical protein